MDVNCVREIELIRIMKARIAEQPSMFITSFENYESLKKSQLNCTSDNTHNSQNNVKLVTSQCAQGVIKKKIYQETTTCTQKTSKEKVCPICSASFLTVQQYEDHKRSCKLQCNICLKTFSKKYFKTHKKTHLSHQFHCNLCSQEMFSTEKYLKKHFKEAHKGESIFKCPVCAKLIATLIVFVKHVTQYHQTKLKCGICNVKYSCRKSIKKHLMRHENKNINVKNEIIKINEPPIDYSKCIVNLEEDNDTIDTEGVDSADCVEQISKNNSVIVKKTFFLINHLQNEPQKYTKYTNSTVNGPLENTELIKTGEIKAVADSSELLKYLATDTVYEVPEKE